MTFGQCKYYVSQKNCAIYLVKRNILDSMSSGRKLAVHELDDVSLLQWLFSIHRTKKNQLTHTTYMRSFYFKYKQ